VVSSTLIFKTVNQILPNFVQLENMVRPYFAVPTASSNELTEEKICEVKAKAVTFILGI
jgi:hypothetical protein